MKVFRRAILLAAAVVSMAACGPGFISGTEIEDTPEKRAIFEVMETYRQAMEQRSVETLAQIVSPRYFENASSTAVQEDDYGYERLREKILPLLQDHIKAVQYRVRLIRVDVKGERAFADYEYWAKFLYSEGGRDGWRSRNDYNRLEFVKEEGSWKITGGL